MTTMPPTAQTLTLADVVTALERDARLEAPRKREYGGAVRTLSRLLGRPDEVIPASLADIELLLREASAAAHSCSVKTIRNTRSRIKAALLHVANRTKLPPYRSRLSDEWAALAAKLTAPRMRHGLSRFIRIASFRGVSPAAVSDDFLQDVLNDMKDVNWGRDTQPFRRMTIALWNEASESIASWPQVRLTPATETPRIPHLALDAFPQSFQRDLADYLNWTSSDDPLSDSAPRVALKPSTVHLRRLQLRLAASTLARHFGDPALVTAVAVLVTSENAKLILTAYLKQNQGRPSAFIRGLATTLLAAARHWVKVPPNELEALKRMTRKLNDKADGLTAKNRRALLQFSDPALLDRLLRLPQALATQARCAGLSPSRRLQKMQIAVAIELLLVAPLRLQNLSTLRLDRQLQWPTGRGGTLYITLREDETKNALPLEYPINGQSKALLHEYLDYFRVQTDARKSPWLFVRLNGVLVSAGALRDGITKAVRRELGVALTPHQFRHLAAKIALNARPGAIGLVKDLLGHRNIKTTLNFYAGMRTREAAQEFDKIIEAQRQLPSLNG